MTPEWEAFQESFDLTPEEVVRIRSCPAVHLDGHVLELLVYELAKSLHYRFWADAAVYLSMLVQSDLVRHVDGLCQLRVGELALQARKATKVEEGKRVELVAKLGLALQCSLMELLETLPEKM